MAFLNYAAAEVNIKIVPFGITEPGLIRAAQIVHKHYIGPPRLMTHIDYDCFSLEPPRRPPIFFDMLPSKDSPIQIGRFALRTHLYPVFPLELIDREALSLKDADAITLFTELPQSESDFTRVEASLRWLMGFQSLFQNYYNSLKLGATHFVVMVDITQQKNDAIPVIEQARDRLHDLIARVLDIDKSSILMCGVNTVTGAGVIRAFELVVDRIVPLAAASVV